MILFESYTATLGFFPSCVGWRLCKMLCVRNLKALNAGSEKYLFSYVHIILVSWHSSYWAITLQSMSSIKFKVGIDFLTTLASGCAPFLSLPREKACKWAEVAERQFRVSCGFEVFCQACLVFFSLYSYTYSIQHYVTVCWLVLWAALVKGTYATPVKRFVRIKGADLQNHIQWPSLHRASES